MKKNWFFTILLSIAALSLAGTAAYFSVFGLSKLFYAAGLGIVILAASLEFAKIVTVSYVYRYWKSIKKFFRIFYIFAVVFIMFLTSVGVYGFLTGAYQQSANKLEMRDSQISIAGNKKDLFVNQLDRVNKSIESSSQRINTLSGLRNQQEKRLDNLYNQKYISVAKRTESQINGSDEQIKLLNTDITEKMKQTTSINDSIAFYDQKIIDLKSSDISNEVGPYKFVSDLTGIPMNKVVNIVALLIILVFDPLAIALLIGVNQLTMIQNEEKEKSTFWNRFKRRRKKETIEDIEKEIINNLEDELSDLSILPELPEVKEELPVKEEITEEMIRSDLKLSVKEDIEVKEEDIEVKEEDIEDIEKERYAVLFEDQEGNIWGVDSDDEMTEIATKEETEIRNETQLVLQFDEPVEPVETETIIEETPVEMKVILPLYNFNVPESINKEENEFTPKKISSITGRINVAKFIPNEQ